MKFYITLIFAVLGALERVETHPTYFEDLDDPFVWPVPQRDGSVLWMTEEEALYEASKTEDDLDDIKTKAKSDKVRFFLYTQQNPTEPTELYLNDLKTLKKASFDPINPTRFMIHGWLTDHRDLVDIREALLLNDDKNQVNYISVDWSVYSETINYISAKKHCSTAGEKVAEFIDWLHNNTGMSFKNLAVYGHSLGAHVAGFTGKNVKQGRVHTIVGMDPAMPLFRFKNPQNRLASTDGEYVETIQTNGGLLGFYKPIGRSAFYPNGGRCQPGCGRDLKGSCSHGRSIAYFAEALSLGHKNGFTAIKCEDFENLKRGNCSEKLSISRLGDPQNARFANGIYYLETNSESPYGIDVK